MESSVYHVDNMNKARAVLVLMYYHVTITWKSARRLDNTDMSMPMYQLTRMVCRLSDDSMAMVFCPLNDDFEYAGKDKCQV